MKAFSMLTLLIILILVWKKQVSSHIITACLVKAISCLVFAEEIIFDR